MESGGNKADGAADLFVFLLVLRFRVCLSDPMAIHFPKGLQSLPLISPSLLCLRADWLLPADTRSVLPLRPPPTPVSPSYRIGLLSVSAWRRPKPNAGRVYVSGGRGVVAATEAVRAKEEGATCTLDKLGRALQLSTGARVGCGRARMRGTPGQGRGEPRVSGDAREAAIYLGGSGGFFFRFGGGFWYLGRRAA